jgi:hypothetical protein
MGGSGTLRLLLLHATHLNFPVLPVLLFPATGFLFTRVLSRFSHER